MRFLKLTPLLFLGACMGATAPAPVTVSEPVAEPEPAVAAVETAPVIEEVKPTLPAPEPARLTGLSPKEVQALVGEPSLVRRDGNVQVMLFEAETCVFEIIFYEPNLDAHFSADHMNARSRSGLDIDLQSCLVTVLPGGQWLDAGAQGH